MLFKGYVNEFYFQYILKVLVVKSAFVDLLRASDSSQIFRIRINKWCSIDKVL